MHSLRLTPTMPLDFTSCICNCGIVEDRVWGENMGFTQVNGVRGGVIVGEVGEQSLIFLGREGV